MLIERDDYRCPRTKGYFNKMKERRTRNERVKNKGFMRSVIITGEALTEREERIQRYIKLAEQGLPLT